VLPFRDIVPLGKVRLSFNFNLDNKRVLNFENVVTDDDNVKQVRANYDDAKVSSTFVVQWKPVRLPDDGQGVGWGGGLGLQPAMTCSVDGSELSLLPCFTRSTL